MDLEERIQRVWKQLNDAGTLIHWHLEPFNDEIAVVFQIEINGEKATGRLVPTLKLFQNDHHLCEYIKYSAAEETKRQILKPRE